jgi:hypothetical protein
MNLYKIDINAKNEFDTLKNLITVYSCYKTIAGEEARMLRPKLVTLLSIYIRDGYNKDSKALACELLDLKKTNLNCLNSELRDGGFLIKSEMNNRESYLNPELQGLSDYYRSNGTNPVLVLFSLTAGSI